MTKRNDKKWAGIARLFPDGTATATTQEIRDGLDVFIKEAVADRDVDALALLAGWFVLVSEDITIDRFKMWMEEGREGKPPTKWWIQR
jgi:hypothetical protein